ncbi:MAG: hypothetical protein PCFJNLEI_00471 [Verrucomicrobiae bacterium]|nr:hypothetical protein [Verrucomicrobiae bacterium]
MKRFQDFPIQKKLAWAIGAILLVDLMLVSLAIFLYERIAVRKTGATVIATIARVVGDRSTAALRLQDAGAAQEALAVLQANRQIVAAALYSATGEVLAQHVRDRLPASVIPPSPDHDEERFLAGGDLVVFRQLIVDGEKLGAIYLRSDLGLFRTQMNLYALTIVGLTVIALLLVWLVTTRLQRVIVNPILELAKLGRTIMTEQNYSLRAVAHNRDEIGVLADVLNQGLTQVEERERALHLANQALQQELAERRAIEKLLADSRDFHLKLLDEFPNPIWRSGKDSQCDYFNKAWLHFTGRTLLQECGNGWTQGVHPHDLERCVHIYREAFQARVPFTMEYRLRRADGSYAWILDTGSPYADLDGEFAGYIGSCLELTQRKQAEAALLQSQIRTESILASVKDVHLVFDHQWHCLYVNEAGVKSIGQSRDQILNGTLWELFPDIIGTELDRQYRRAMTERTAVTFEFHYVTNNTWWENRFYPAPEGLAVFASDITDRMRAKQDREQLLEELRKANAGLRHLTRRVLTAQEDERRRLARELHDEAGQALTVLKLWLVTLSEELPGTSAAQRQRLAEAAQLTDDTMDHLRHLAQDLRPPALETLPLAACLSGYCREFSQRTGLRVDYHGSEVPVLPDEVNVCLYRVVQEALTNVAKHARARRSWVELWHRNGMVSLAVFDDGRGFAAPADKATSLGLLGMQERLELLGGRLEITSRPGAGTQLIVYIPVENTDD